MQITPVPFLHAVEVRARARNAPALRDLLRLVAPDMPPDALDDLSSRLDGDQSSVSDPAYSLRVEFPLEAAPFVRSYFRRGEAAQLEELLKRVAGHDVKMPEINLEGEATDVLAVWKRLGRA